MSCIFKYKDCDIEVSESISNFNIKFTSISLSGLFNGFNCQIKHKYNGYCLFIEDEYFGIFDDIYADYELYEEKADSALSVLENEYEKLVNIYREIYTKIHNKEQKYEWFYNFSDEEISFINSNIGTEYGQDNYRVGVEGDENSMNAYYYFKSQGCCGFDDKTITFNNKTFHIGYNYGH